MAAKPSRSVPSCHCVTVCTKCGQKVYIKDSSILKMADAINKHTTRKFDREQEEQEAEYAKMEAGWKKHRTLKPQNRSLHPSPSGDVPPSSPQTQCKSILEPESPISIDGPDDMPSSPVSSTSSEASVASSTGSKKMCVKDADGETLVLPQELRMFKKLRVNGAAKAPVDLDE